MNFGKLLTAMVTPFDSEGLVDSYGTRRLVNHLIDTGTDGIVVAGTTGESPTLSNSEKIEMFKIVVEEVNGRVPVIAGTGSNNTQASIELTKEAELVGVDGIMLVAPYYNKPSQRGLYEHFRVIAESTTLPIMLYNIPGRTSVNIEPETIIQLAQIENIVSVKEASGDLDAATQIIRETTEDFSVYCGDDGMTLPMLSVGGAGVVSVAAHIVGLDMKEMIERFYSGDIQGAAELHGQILPVVKALFIAPNPTAVKEALNMQGTFVGGVRLPLVPLTINERQHLVDTLKYFHAAAQ